MCLYFLKKKKWCDFNNLYKSYNNLRASGEEQVRRKLNPAKCVKLAPVFWQNTH